MPWFYRCVMTTNETKHSPAPWKYIQAPYNGNTDLYEVQFGDDGECVCEIVHTEANAKLIAAAPDMYAALIYQKELNEWIENADPEDPFFEETLRLGLNHASDLINEAINKAEI